MKHYTYKGPVMIFGKIVEENWSGSTYAQTEKKARNNLMFQYKKQNRKMVGSTISLPGKVVLQK